MEEKKAKEIIGVIGTVGTVIFKMFIFVTVMGYLGTRLDNWVWVWVLPFGIIWTLGIGNMVLLYLIFKRSKFNKDGKIGWKRI